MIDPGQAAAIHSALVIHAHYVFITGPAEAIAPIVAWFRTWGHRTAEPEDLLAQIGSPNRDSIAYARAAAETLTEVDAVVLAPGWRNDPHAVSTRISAEALDLPIYEWSEWHESQQSVGT